VESANARTGFNVAKESTPLSPNRRNPNPPGSWIPFRRKIRRFLAPVERFLAIEAASGIVLMVAALTALVLANSSWGAAYADLWHTPIGFRFGTFAFERDLHFWINDGLMTVFFFVVGLEIRREIHSGELSKARRAALPLAAALGGMLVPALIFVALNVGRPSAVGWAVPMATDIAFAVGALVLLGNRVTTALRILLLAVAVIDDVGAIIVIALFYSTALVGTGFLIMALGVLAIFAMQLIGIRSPLAYVAPGGLIWAGAYTAGIHPTLAGVIVGLMTPVKSSYGAEEFLDETAERVRLLRSDGVADTRALLPHLDSLKAANREAVPPVEKLQHILHSWVAFGIMPLFAFANAGVRVGQITFGGDATWVFWGVVLGLTIGKPMGIVTVSWLAARLGFVALPGGISWRQVGVVGMVGGIGFTMALFIAELAFSAGGLLETTKLAILCGSGLAGVVSLIAGYNLLKPRSSPTYRLD
jgi:Na+:H+ antiporter, NhaA family